jgi:hypothetical protein
MAVGAVAGYCPMGCGQTLVLDGSGHIFCSAHECPQANAVDEILGDREHEHIVKFEKQRKGYSWSIQHPLRERVGHKLLDCEIVRALDRQAETAEGNLPEGVQANVRYRCRIKSVAGGRQISFNPLD